MTAVAPRGAAIVTGGTRGIGLGIAGALARDGWDLLVCGVRAPEEAAGALEQLARHGRAVHYHRADLSVPADRDALDRKSTRLTSSHRT